MRTFGVVFARGGSKGIPRKNLSMVNGRSLLERAISAGLSTPGLESVVVSTDDEEIAEEARRLGAEVPFMRPAELATDSSPELLSWKHAVSALTESRGEFDAMLSIPPTAPLRSVDDLIACLEKLKVSENGDLVITVSRSRTNPAFNMVTIDEGERAHLCLPGFSTTRRQDARTVYDMTTVGYAARAAFVMGAESIWDGVVLAVEVPRNRAVDIDDPLDLEIAAAIENARDAAHD